MPPYKFAFASLLSSFCSTFSTSTYYLLLSALVAIAVDSATDELVACQLVPSLNCSLVLKSLNFGFLVRCTHTENCIAFLHLSVSISTGFAVEFAVL